MGNSRVVRFRAVDESGRVDAALPSVDCLQSLVAADRPLGGVVLDPGTVLDALDGYRPDSWVARQQYSAILRLAVLAKACGLLIRGDEDERPALVGR